MSQTRQVEELLANYNYAPSFGSRGSNSLSLSSPTTTMSSVDVPTPPSYSLFDREMEHIFHETIDTSFLDSRPCSPTSFALGVLDPVENLDRRLGRHEEPVDEQFTPACPPHLTLSLPHAPPQRRPSQVETKRQIDVLTTILTSPNLLPTSLPSLPIPRQRSRSPSSSLNRAKDEILNRGGPSSSSSSSSSSSTSTSMKSQKSWLDALKEAELKAKAKRLAASNPGFARL
ncbi:hypothetical protein JCM3766R1_001561 [Sporobolomyces carnicolor]